jgi:hypothetical protein
MKTAEYWTRGLKKNIYWTVGRQNDGHEDCRIMDRMTAIHIIYMRTAENIEQSDGRILTMRKTEYWTGK